MWRWTFSSFLLFTFSHLCKCNEQFVVVAPNLIRTDVEENIFLQAFGLSQSLEVTITIRDYDTSATLIQQRATLNQNNGYLTLAPVKIPSQNMAPEQRRHKYTFLEVTFGNKHFEKRAIMVSFQAGYIFIQTDKPIYKPDEDVRVRFYVSSPSLKASDLKAVSFDIKNPDDVVIIQKSKTKPSKGILATSFNVPTTGSEGKWMIIAKFDDWPQNTFNTTFEVKKYVLPAFNVTLTPRVPYLDVDDSQLHVDITARYLFGESVLGTAYVVYGLKKGNQIMRAPTVKKVDMQEHGGTLTLSVTEITQACKVKSGNTQSDCSIRSLVDSYVYIKVSVITESGGDLVEVEKSSIKIVKSPYVLQIKDMQKYFKPGLPFDFTIYVHYHDGTPAHNVSLKVTLYDLPLSSFEGKAQVSINMPREAHAQTITVTTISDPREDRQVKKSVTLEPYRSANPHRPNYLYLSPRTQVDQVDLRELAILMTISSAQKRSIKEISYVILSKGKILDGKHVKVGEQDLTIVPITVTQEMIPSFRFVAFYILSGEVVSDSIKLEVSETCVTPPIISAVTPPVLGYYRPGSSPKLQIKGEPSATISVAVVDQAVYLLNKNRFTQRHILDEVESKDTGCTRGSGKNAMGVFSDAGLLFAMKNGPSTENRQELNCPVDARRRRSTVLMEHQTQLLGQFQEKLLQRCCRDGLRGVLMPYTCEQRSQFIAEGNTCIEAFLKCCNVYKNKVTSLKHDGYVLGRSSGTGSSSDGDPDENDALTGWGDEDEDEDEEYDLEALFLREKFEETWIWRDFVVTGETDLKGLGTVSINQPLPDSITQWSVLAVSSSMKTGFCVAEPWTLIVKQPFFVDLKLPFSVAKNEQVEIKAVVYNYLDEDLEVSVVLQRTKDMCSVAFKKRQTKRITVRAHSSAAVPYTIVPFTVGKIPIEVAAYVMNRAGDRVQKTLNVVAMGVQKIDSETFFLNPSNYTGNKQVVRTSKQVPKGVVPNSDPQRKILFTGNMLADTIDGALKDDPLASLIRMPGGCVEQNLASITFPVIATVYLERTKGWETVGVQRQVDAYRYIDRGLSNQRNYQSPDGSYPPYGGRGPGTWITAYVVKVFTMIYSLNRDKYVSNIDDICQSVKFLVQNKQSNDGSFTEANPVTNRYISTGGLQGSDFSATLTAFVTIAFAEVRQLAIDCSYKGVNMQSAINKAVPYLKRQLQKSPPPRPYTTAIISYALALLGDDPTSTLLAASTDGTYWHDSNFQFKLEATGYALLALVKMRKLTEAKKPFDYLSSNRRAVSYSGNTQSTIVVFHALTQYLIAKPPPGQRSLTVNVEIDARKEAIKFIPETSYRLKSLNVPENANLKVVAEGNGTGTVELVTIYNQLPEENVKSCEAFDMQISMNKSTERPPPGTISVFELSVSVKALEPVSAHSVVLDISLPTGFTVETRDLENLLNSVERYIDHFYFDDKLSDRSSLIIHLYEVSNTVPRIVSFRLYQQFNVGLLQPSSVTVYNYYEDKEKSCTQLYSPPLDHAELNKLCTNNYVCVCAQDDCCSIWRGTDDREGTQRKTLACTGIRHVFKVKVLNVTSNNFDRYEVNIIDVIKLGAEPDVLISEKRFFYSHGGCNECKLQVGSDYFIMGPKSDRWTEDTTNNKYMYVLSKDTWVERWPTETECNDPAFQAQCKSLKAAARSIFEEPCQAKK